MCAPVTGTAVPVTVAHITLLAALAVLSVVHSRMTWLVPSTPNSRAREGLVAAAAEDLDGNLVIGYVADQDAMSTTLQAGLNVSNAVLQGTHTRNGTRLATLLN
ncbi:hypothetical protein PIB30_049564 [Stylosanthes scabra]|uniref:Uncharacterized protein n=1 Tax=Stylosanthes scabra TaxID=79078 RepID=A0ABU6RHY3_9FABA|nr:hypothetical protein [Stylosanthes scabra]